MGLLELFPLALMMIVYLGITGVFIYLILRFIRAHERIAESIERISNKP